MLRKSPLFVLMVALFFLCPPVVPGALAHAQSTATLQGGVVDQQHAVVPGAKLTLIHRETGAERAVETDDEGHYYVAALPVGSYRVEVRAGGFRTAVVESLNVEVARVVVQDFKLGWWLS